LFTKSLLATTFSLFGATAFATIANAQTAVPVDFSGTLPKECTFGTPTAGSLTPNNDSTALETTTGNEAEVVITCNTLADLTVDTASTTIEYTGSSDLFGTTAGDDPQLSGSFIPLDLTLSVLDRDNADTVIIDHVWTDGTVTSPTASTAPLTVGTKTVALDFDHTFAANSGLPNALKVFPEGTYTTTATLSVLPQ
jgi:hypothetical protein